MNFAFDSVKPKAKTLNEDFYFDFETPRGHCFIVLDFVSHDYANLNATLKGKLETIGSSFASLPGFSPSLFLGFVAKEINNFIHNLAEQAGGPELLCSAALCFVSGNELSYFLRGNTRIDVLQDGVLQPLRAESNGNKDNASALGGGEIEAPTSEVQTRTLAENDVVLIMTKSVAETKNSIAGSDLEDAKSICNALFQGDSATEDRTAVVICGPYMRQVAEIPTVKFEAELNNLKEELGGKANAISLLELGGKIDSLVAAVAGKADNSELLELRRDVLKLNLATKSGSENLDQQAESQSVPTVPPPSSSGALLKTALVALIISLAAGFLGGWFFHRRNRPAPEVWTVRSAGNQVSIVRQNGSAAVLNLARPVKFSGEQTFSSFADVTQYIDRITAPDDPAKQSDVAQVQPQASPTVTEVIVKPGDSLKRFALRYNVPQERIMELNPGITRWPYIKAGQRVLIPAPALPVPSPAAAQANPQSGR